MKCRLVTLVVCAALAIASPAFAQGGGTQTISGVVVDTGGGVVPGAEVQVKNNATGVGQSQVSNAEGGFSFAGMQVGTYTVTVTLQGFKTFVSNDVVVTSGAPAAVRATLEVGGLEEQVVVSSKSEIVQTQSTVISSTINTSQISKLPITSRSAMDFVTLLPGVTTPGGNRQSQINGLPQGVINITLDGVNIQDNTLRSTDGFFAIVSPRLDAIEEVTVTTATQEASAGQGAVQIKFVTRSGGNDFTGSGYHYFRSDKLNANTWFNNRNAVAKAKLKQNQYGVRAGGPIVQNKAFFFANYEEFRQPSGVTRNRNILNAQAQQGIFTYVPTGGSPQTVNLLALAAANGQTSTQDPTIAGVLRDIRAAVAGGSIANIDDNLERYTFNVSTESVRRYPTTRVDYNITDKHRFSNAFNYQKFTDFPDTLNNMDATFPGFPVEAGQKSERYSISNALRSTLGANMVNEALVAWSGAPVTFFGELSPDNWGGTSVADQLGYRITFPGTAGMNPVSANPTGGFNPQSRNASTLQIENTLTWLKGRHSLSMGGSWTQYDLWLKNQQLVPNITLGIANGDPASGLFTGANFPGASAAQLAAAQSLYAIMTGRVTSVAGNAALGEDSGEYEYLGNSIQRSRMREAGFFVQDSWRVRPNLTVNAGLRYELQYPFTPRNDSYSTVTLDSFCGVSGTNSDTICNLFQPGATPGTRPTFVNFGSGTAAYDTDYNNFAPSLGVAWTLRGSNGFMGTILGRNEGDSVIRGGFTRAFSREGMARFSDRFGANPGVTINDPTRSEANGNLGALPVLFRDQSRLAPAAFPLTPQYPLTELVSGDANLMDPKPRGPVCRFMDDRHSAHDRPEHGVRSPLRGNPLARHLGPAGLQRDQHLRERVPERIPGRAGQPAGERRQRRRESGLRLPRTRHRDRSAANHVRVFPGCWRSEQRRGVYVRELPDEQHLPDAAGDLQPEPVRLCEQPSGHCGTADECDQRGPCVEFLRREPRPDRWHQHGHQRRPLRLQRTAARAAAPAVAGPAVPVQLLVRPAGSALVADPPP